MNSVIFIDYEKFKQITGISDENFRKRTKKEKIDRLLKNGYVVKNIIGIGTKAIFECEVSEKFKIETKLNEKLGLKAKHSKVMNIYLDLLICENGCEYMFMSDRQVAEIIKSKYKINYTSNTLIKYVCDCRMDLTKSGWMTPITKDKNTKDKTDRIYKIISIENNVNKEITLDDYNNIYSNVYYAYISLKIKELKSQNIDIDMKILKNVSKEAKSIVFETVGGVPTVIYKKDFNVKAFKEGE